METLYRELIKIWIYINKRINNVFGSLLCDKQKKIELGVDFFNDVWFWKWWIKILCIYKNKINLY